MSGDRSSRVRAYHERTKHHLHRYARSLGYLDWDTQPAPFRRYQGAELVLLDEIPPAAAPSFDHVLAGTLPPRPVERASVSQLFYDSLAISAWKQHGRARWSLRVNPSSGNLHPTEAFLLAGPIEGLTRAAGLFHYAPHEHALERRATLADADWQRLAADLGAGALIVGLASIHWREAWKYGERAFRYCHHDAGHAIAAVAVAAAALGWHCRRLPAPLDVEIAGLLGIADERGPEKAQPDCLLAISAAAMPPATVLESWSPPAEIVERIGRACEGVPSPLSADHHAWPALEEAHAASVHDGPRLPLEPPPPMPIAPERVLGRDAGARLLVRRRRSAVDFDGTTRIGRADFFRMLAATCAFDRAPLAALGWAPSLHLALFVHRVDDVAPGLYLLVRDRTARDALRAALDAGFEWMPAPGVPEALDLVLLARGDARDAARTVSCHQDIAADGAFAVAMLADFSRLAAGAWWYRALHREAGAVGQILYLEAEAASVRATGIGCFFDDALHELLGLEDPRWQSLYHFTIGGAVDDARLVTRPAYEHLRGRR